MENVSFVLWVVLFPLSNKIGSYISIKHMGIRYTEAVKRVGTLIEGVIWVGIGILLWK